MPKTSQHHLAQSGVDSAEDRNDSEYAIQSMIELEEKRLERMLTPNEVDNIVRCRDPHYYGTRYTPSLR
jgi:hypothetical protein